MAGTDQLRQTWIATRDRLVAKGLLEGAAASVSLRCPADGSFLFGSVADGGPARIASEGPFPDAVTGVHADIYARRVDVGAIALGNGPFAGCLAEFGGRLPQLFDEQARHLGPMPPPATSGRQLAAALAKECSAVFLHGELLCFGSTATRLALNAELFEKCAEAYVLAVASGARVRALPWWVRLIANGRLRKDRRRAAEAHAAGKPSAESVGY